MAKKVRKWTPMDPYDCIALETWLEDMARKGFLLKKFRPLFCTFERGEPVELRCRVEPWRRHWDEDPPQAMLDLYEEFGWKWVGEAGRDFLLFTARDLAAPEPHSDPELQRGQWERVRKSLLWRALGSAALFLMFLSLIILAVWRNGRPVLGLVKTNLPILLAGVCIYPPQAAEFLRQAQQIAKITQQLREGVPLEHRAMYLRRRLSGLAGFTGTAVILVLLLACRWVFPLSGGPARNLDGLEDFVPLTLSSLEKAPYREEHFVMDGVDYLAVARRGEDDFQLAAAAARGRAAVVRYTGTGDLADHFEEIALMVTERRTT